MTSDVDRPSESMSADTPSAKASDVGTRPDVHVTTPAVPPSPTPVPQARKPSATRAAWFALIVGAVALIFLLVFVLQNNVSTQFTFWAWTFTMPLGVAMLFAAIAGALVTAMVGAARMFVLGRNVRNLEHQRDKTREALKADRVAGAITGAATLERSPEDASTVRTAASPSARPSKVHPGGGDPSSA